MPRYVRSGWQERRQPSNSALRDFSDLFRESGWCHNYRVVSTEPSSTFLQPESSWPPFTESPEFGSADGPYAYEDPQKLRTHDELWAFLLIQDLPQGLVLV
ncbi:hypothetical protein AtubIFM54640_011315 [Aspergillus tubingensis]|nr:hypothetical protein AtubIFM54640_011315 [Aspergillus tubingensis]